VWGVITNKPPTGAYRGAGGPEAAFCLERTIDLIARDLQLDPATVRRQNFIPPEAFPYETPTGLTYDSGDYAKTLDPRPTTIGIRPLARALSSARHAR
jgi:carbon-monoxide dehydrogenase large subunit